MRMSESADLYHTGAEDMVVSINHLYTHTCIIISLSYSDFLALVISMTFYRVFPYTEILILACILMLRVLVVESIYCNQFHIYRI